MATRPEGDLWIADLEEALSRRDLFEQRQYLESRIERADAWLEAHPDADDVWYDRFETLVDLHAEVMERVNRLNDEASAEICLLLPADYAGAVGHEWRETENGELRAWFTRDQLEAAGWINTALCARELEAMASAA